MGRQLPNFVQIILQGELIDDRKQKIITHQHNYIETISSMPTDPIANKRNSRSVSSFLKKTYEILENSDNNYAIRWAHTGIGFVVVKEQAFSKQILPSYFKHSNYSSFVRQLNMYNFHKIREANNESHFHHQFFKRNNKALLSEIKRKPEKKKRKNQECSEDDHQFDHDKSDVSMKHKIKQNSISNINSKIESGEIKIKSYKSTDKKSFEPTRHVFCSEKQNQFQHFPSGSEPFKGCYPSNQDNAESKQRVSIQNILSGSAENDDDKISINNQLAEGFPRYPTKQMFYPSNNNIYPFPLNFKGANVISHLNIFF